MIASKRYSLDFESASGIYTGMGVAGLVDRFVMRDAASRPVVPGSTVKGRWRYFAERLARSAAATGISAHDSGFRFCPDAATQCTVCRLFGSPAKPARVAVSPALPSAEATATLLRQPNTGPATSAVLAAQHTRPGIAMSRINRTALTGHLFFDEVVPPARFTGEIRLLAPVSKDEWEFLRLAASLVDALGARKNTGRGRLLNGIEIEK